MLKPAPNNRLRRTGGKRGSELFTAADVNSSDPLLRAMRHVQPDLAAVFLTGFTTIDVVYPAIEAGVLRVLAKPPDFEELIPIIEEHIDTAA